MPIPTTSLSPITPAQSMTLENKARGPFSFRYRVNDTRTRLVSDTAYTSYPAPDGGWTWATCPAEDWTPDLSGYPTSKNT